MFRRAQEKNNAGTSEIGLLGVDSHFEGIVRFAGTLRVDGRVEGDIASEPGSGSVLVINQSAEVLGNIVSDIVLISGQVVGQVTANERVEIFRNGSLKGDIYTADIMIEGGAEFEGRCHMTNEDEDVRIAVPTTNPKAQGVTLEKAEGKRAGNLPVEPT